MLESIAGLSYQGIQIPREVEMAIMEAKAENDELSGISREYIVDMAPVTEGAGYQQTELPQANVPYATGQEFPPEPAEIEGEIVVDPALVPTLPAGFGRRFPGGSLPILPARSR